MNRAILVSAVILASAAQVASAAGGEPQATDSVAADHAAWVAGHEAIWEGEPDDDSISADTPSASAEPRLGAHLAPGAERLRDQGLVGEPGDGEFDDENLAEESIETRGLPAGMAKSAVKDTATSVPTGGGTIDGMGESFSTQLSTGAASFSLPILVPRARGGAQPTLSLSYGSGAGLGVAGMGWSLGVAYISRETDNGLPEYDDRDAWHPGQDRFVFNGGQELVPVCDVADDLDCSGALESERMPEWASGWMYFRARVEGSFSRFFWSPDRRTWRVQGKNGITLELGVPLDGTGYTGALQVAPSDSDQVFQWNLARKFDAHGDRDPLGNLEPVNVAYYKYRTDGDRPYLQDIFATSPAKDPTTRNLSRFAHHVRLRYEDRPDPTDSYRTGWRVEQTLRLVGVDVTSKTYNGGPDKPRALVRRYHLAYDATSHVSLLESLTVEGRCTGTEDTAPTENGDVLDEETNCPRLLPMVFGYSRVDGTPQLTGYEPLDQSLVTLGSSPEHSLSEGLTDLFDFNSDGLPDVLSTAPSVYGNRHAVFFNGVGGAEDSFGEKTLIAVTGISGASANSVKLDNPNVTPLDLDGDGLSNLLHLTGSDSYAIYSPSKNNGSWVWRGREVESEIDVDFGSSARATRVVDINFDGLVDILVSTGNELQSYLSLGRYPDGHGRFGHASYASDGSLRLSDEPVRRCLPTAGLPVDLGDSEIRLADMNGDGIVDIARVQPGRLLYWPGRGNGYFGTGSREDCEPGVLVQDEYVEMDSAPWSTSWASNEYHVGDVNGDGLSDLVHVMFDAVGVYLNVDGRGWTERALLRDTPATPPYARQVRLADANGSGTLDIIWGDAHEFRYIDLQGGERPWLLTNIDNALGKSTTVEYSTSVQEMLAAERAGDPWSATMPTVAHVVTSRTEKDNLGELAGTHEYRVEYTYRDPVFDGQQREFRGFRGATETQIGDAYSPTDSTAYTFLLGECVDEESDDGVDACSPEQRWRDNSREALKGRVVVAETFDDEGIYSNTQHVRYRLRRLYAGLDGRDVRHAFPERVTGFVYDTAEFERVDKRTTLYSVRVESEQGSGAAVVGGDDDSEDVLLRSTRGMAKIRRDSVVDWFGNQTKLVAWGCVGGGACKEPDEVITEREVPRVLDTPDAWMWVTRRAWIEGSEHPGRRNEVMHSFNKAGENTRTRAVLTGTLPLVRVRDEGIDRGVAEPPQDASADAPADSPLLLSRAHMDKFGNLVLSRGANKRCSKTKYDSDYKVLIVAEALFPGGCGDLSASGKPDTSDLFALTSAAAYDRGLGAPTINVDVTGQHTRIVYDDFGRMVEVYRPHPGAVQDASETSGFPGACSAPSVVFEYALPDVTRHAYSLVRTRTQEGLRCDSADYSDTYTYLDGFGRTLVHLTEADPDTALGDGHAWVAEGVQEFDAKGAPRRQYLPFFFDGDARKYPLTTVPKAQYGRQRLDAFGRPIQIYDVDGTVTYRGTYGALSANHWDAADLQNGPHAGTFITVKSDGHGRGVQTTERLHIGRRLEQRHTIREYLPTGQLEVVRRRLGDDDSSEIVRWARFDSLGRLVLNVAPSTTAGFDPSPDFDADAMSAWRYAYNDANDLVGISDARGCGMNFTHDGFGRLTSEDYSPCEAHHAAYSEPSSEAGSGALRGFEALFLYDTPVAPFGLEPPPTLDLSDPNSYLGRDVAVWDRGSVNWARYDARGRMIESHVQVAKPRSSATASDPYAPRWYRRDLRFDADNREVWSTTGATTDELQGFGVSFDPAQPNATSSSRSAVTTSYTQRGAVASVAGSYGPLLARVAHTADGRTDTVVYGDAADTRTRYSYDHRRRLQSVQTYRGPPALWSASATYSPAPEYGGESPISSFQLLLQDTSYTYDVVGNPTQIRDWRLPQEWPEGAQPVTRDVEYDDLYRISRVDYSYPSGDDEWQSPYRADLEAPDSDPRRAQPAPHVDFTRRVLWQTFEYDWLGNQLATSDDANGFYDRSLGAITNGPTDSPYRLMAAASAAPRADNSDWLGVTYDKAGNTRSLTIARGGECLGESCSQHFEYEWDEVGRLVGARRWDADSAEEAARLAEDAGEGRSPPAADAQVDLRYEYDSADERVLKTAADGDGDESHTVYVFDTLELRRAQWLSDDYELTELTEVPFLFADGNRLARVVYEPAERVVPSVDDGWGRGSKIHVFFELGDHLGSTNVVLDQQTGELVEYATFLAYGSTESDYRPDRWANFRADYRFTGKEEDVEAGIIYFGKRFLNPQLGRWLSPDPLAIHAAGEADLNAYAYIRGQVLRGVDEVGLRLKQVQAGSTTITVVVTHKKPAGMEALQDGQLFLMPAARKESSPLNLNESDPKKRFLKAAAGKVIYQYEKPNKKGAVEADAAARAELIEAIQAAAPGSCTGPACGTAKLVDKPANPSASGQTDYVDLLIMLGAFAAMEDPNEIYKANGKARGGGSCDDCQSSQGTAMVLAAARILAMIDTGGATIVNKPLKDYLYKRALSKLKSTLGKPAKAWMAAHHIIPWGEPTAAALQKVAKKYGLDLNSAQNGVHLPHPTPKKVGDVPGRQGAPHQWTYDDGYIDFLEHHLLTAPDKAAFMARLAAIKRGLETGDMSGLLKISP